MNYKWVYVFLAALFIAGFVSLFASAWPDGLEAAAEEIGFVNNAREAIINIMPDYVIPGMGNEILASALASVAGTLLTFTVLWGGGKLMFRKLK
ncbi:MAG: PDGLE domain-containing protein [bacterium]